MSCPSQPDPTARVDVVTEAEARLRHGALKGVAALMRTPQISIVIVTFGKRKVSERCLSSLDAVFGSRLGQDIELVLVDNASADDTPDLLRSWADRARVILLDENRNFSGGNNVGARVARGQVLVLLNNDTEVTTGALEHLAAQAMDNGVGIAGCRLLYPDGTIQHGGSAWFRCADGWVRPFHLFRHESGDLPAACATLDCDVVTGACIAIRRELFLLLGGLDESFVNGWEDVDLCVRARMAGHRVVYRGDIEVVHAEGATRGRSCDETNNERIFFSRYAHLTEDDSPRFEAQFDTSGPHFGVAMHPGCRPEGTGISIEGEVTGLAGESAEARSLLVALEAAGLAPATREWQAVTLLPNLPEGEWAPVLRARGRATRRDALVVQAPVGGRARVELDSRAVLRVAEAPGYDVSGAAAVWAASRDVADELIEVGVDPDRVEVLPPLIGDIPVGAGGRGILAVLPAHDLAQSRAVLAALSHADDGQPIRLLPTAATEPLNALVQSQVPAAELLAPVASEQRFAELAGRADVVVCTDRRDAFDRRALIAAAAGAAVACRPDGIAASILGGELVVFDGSAGAVEAAWACPRARAQRAAAVAEVCGPRAVVPHLRELAGRAAELAASAVPHVSLPR